MEFSNPRESESLVQLAMQLRRIWCEVAIHFNLIETEVMPVRFIICFLGNSDSKSSNFNLIIAWNMNLFAGNPS